MMKTALVWDQEFSIPTNLDVDHARLPAMYESAKSALAECQRIDECKTWADKAEALASYARQCADETLRKMCDRIQARAVRRCGELLKEIRPASGRKNAGAHTFSTRAKAARNAGLSLHQQHTAIRVANVPKQQFDRVIDSDAPPTVTQLAATGTKKRAPKLDHLQGRAPADFQQATRVIGLLDRTTQQLAEINLAAAMRGFHGDEIQPAFQNIARLRDWLNQVEGGLRGIQRQRTH